MEQNNCKTIDEYDNDPYHTDDMDGYDTDELLDKLLKKKKKLLNFEDEDTVDKNKDIVFVKNLHYLYYFDKLVSNQKLIAFDSEGVNLSRTGELTIITIGVNTQQDNNDQTNRIQSFVFDMLNNEIKLEQLNVLKSILENNNVKKIIHDCRADSDILYYKFNIKLNNVFDTCAVYQKITNKDRRDNLNNTLSANNCKINKYRPNLTHDFYQRNPTYWANRPLTQNMIDHAGSDVLNLHDLYFKLMKKYNTILYHKFNIDELNEKSVNEFRTLPYHKIVEVLARNKGRVIGRGGSNLKIIERRSNTIIASQTNKGFLVLANSNNNIYLAEKYIRESINSFW